MKTAAARRALAALWSALTMRGRLMGFAAAAGLGAGGVLRWREAFVVGAAAAMALALSSLLLIGRPRYEVKLEVEQERTTVGVPVFASVALRDRSRLRWWSTHIELRIGGGPVQLPMPRRSGETLRVPVPATARGVVRVGPVRTVRADPLGLFRRVAQWSQSFTVHVHPAVVLLPPMSTGFVRDLEGNPTSDLTNADIAFHDLREYRPGDDPRHVYWKAVARTGELMVRQFEQTRRSHLVIAFGRDEAGWASPDEFELGVSAVASLALRALGDGQDLSVVTTPDDVPPGRVPARAPLELPHATRPTLLDALAEVRLGSASLGVGELSGLAAAGVAGVSIVFLVVGSLPAMRQLRAWTQRFPVGVRTVAVVCQPGAASSARDVAGLRVVRVGSLHELRRALGRGVAA